MDTGGMRQWRNDVLLGIAVYLFASSLGAVILGALGLLPALLVKLEVAIEQYLAALLAIVGVAVLALLTSAWKSSRHRMTDIASGLLGALLTLALMLAINFIAHHNVTAHGQGPTLTPAPSPTSTLAPTPISTLVPSPTSTLVKTGKTWTEQEADIGADSFADPHNASGPGPHLDAKTYVQVSCKVYAPQIASATPDGYWYRIASAPWSDKYYVAANTFWNGDVPGQRPYTHFTDMNVPNC